MSDTLTRVEPVPSAPFVGEGISISLAAPMMRYSLRARLFHFAQMQFYLSPPHRCAQRPLRRILQPAMLSGSRMACILPWPHPFPLSMRVAWVGLHMG